MRSRPRLKLFLSGEPWGGGRLLVHLEVLARTETPIDWIDLVLRGTERRAYTVTAAADPIAQWASVDLVGLLHRLPARTLARGKHEQKVAFDLPAALPPTFRSPVTRIEYALDVHVNIPWWPDRRVTYAIPVRLRPQVLAPPEPVRAASDPGHGPELVVELSLEDRSVTAGTPFAGAVSVQNLRGRSVRRVDLSLVALDRAHHGGRIDVEALRTTATIFEGTPGDGASLPFSVVFPADLAPSFQGRLVSLHHALELRVVVAWHDDFVVRLPVVVVPAGSAASAPRQGVRRVPPVGSERRALVWAELAQGGLDFDAEAERLYGAVGGVRLQIGAEQRGGQGLWTVASLRWPALGIDLRAANRVWHDALRPAVELADFSVRDKLTVRGREPTQTAAFFDRLGVAPLPFDEVTFDDDGCVVASPGGSFTPDEARQFVVRALTLCRAVDAARGAVPPPAAMAAHLPAWRAFAARAEGVLHTGEPRIVEASLEGAPIEVVTLWERAELVATELATVRRAPLGDDDADAPAPDPAALQAVPARVRAVLDPVVARGGSLQADAARLAVRAPGPLGDPETAVPILRALAEWARALDATPERGPYR